MSDEMRARALRDLATARGENFIDGLSDVTADVIGGQLGSFDLDRVLRAYRELAPAIRGALAFAGYSEKQTAAWAWRLRARVAFRIEDDFAGDALTRAENLYHAAAAGGDFEASAALLIARALRRLPPQERERIAHELGNELAIGELATGAGDAVLTDADRLWRRGRAIAHVALLIVEQGEWGHDAKRELRA